ncbi:O-succinylbenzoic acid--CoA ligase [Dyadobacter jejuensis]|uniref:O-succinylbenzoic acid--CoA ligase n=1 Tax=Dyadobacter jejuensis TaxID=1082580 RepID=A0A316ANY9_9BACT|nr:AMP-binding protein [Dyadobacter jejuensis]PWJ59039.1 O-succinylbenzoic acid--CoA ligase [Dyadobacter jejuensis]
MLWKTNKQAIQNGIAPAEGPFNEAYVFLKNWLNGQQEFYLKTSGSTGIPKQIVLTRNQLTASALATGEALQLGAGSRVLVCLNTGYIAGMMMLVRAMVLDWELTIVPPAANPFITLPESEVFDFTAMVPLQLEAILTDPRTPQALDRVALLLLGGGPVSPSLQQKISRTPIRVYQSYGMTETVSHIALKRLNPALDPYYTILPGISIGTDSRGCIHITGEVTAGQLVQCNDLVRIIDDRHFEWIGRADNVINSGGVKIVLDQVDQKIALWLARQGLEWPFFTWYESDERLGQKLVLFLNLDGQKPSRNWILSQLKPLLSNYESPKEIYFTGVFQKTATDKIDKKKTAESFFKQTT